RASKGSCSKELGSDPDLTDPAACVAEHAHPGRVLYPTPYRAVGRPGHLHGAEHALGVRHDDGEAPVGRGEAGDAAGGAARIVGISLDRLAAVVDVAHARMN